MTTAEEKEQIQLEVLGSRENDGTLLVETVNSNIKNHISGVTTDDATSFPLKITYTKTGNSYSIFEDGLVLIYTKPLPLAKDVLKLNPSSSNDSERSPYVNYIDSNDEKILCRLLYDCNTSYGVEIISSDSVETVFLGSNDSQVSASDFEYTGSATMSSYAKKCAASYNRAIATLNAKAESYLNTNKIALSARCVGSNPNHPNDIEETLYNDTTNSYMTTYSWNNIFKENDTNYETDYEQMNTLNILNIGKSYYLASRGITSTSSMTGFGVGQITATGTLQVGRSYYFFRVNSTGKYSTVNQSNGFRPVFHLNSDTKIIDGNGTFESPYELEI